MKTIIGVAIIIFLGGLVLQACGNDCKKNDRIICKDGAMIWLDSCGNEGDKEEDCECGCNADYSACEEDCKECETNDDCPTGYWCDRIVWECKPI